MFYSVGAKCKPGEIPEKWMSWSDVNLLQGVDPLTVLQILRSKGFLPHLNILLLHKIIAWQKFDEFLREYPDFLFEFGSHPETDNRWDGIPGENTGKDLPAYFKLWAKKTVSKGIDGLIILKMLEMRGLSVSTDFTFFSQQLINGDLSPGVTIFLDFHMACEEGYSDVVKIYCESGVDIEEDKISRKTKELQGTLSMAAINNHIEVCKILIEYGIDVKKIDNRGRSALHYAASKGNTLICELLLDNKAEIFSSDFLGNNPIHISAYNNHINTLFFLANKGLDYVRAVTADAITVQPNSTFEKLVSETYYNLQDKLLSQSETRRFEKAWLSKASALLLSQVDINVRHLLPNPNCNPQIFTDVLARSDPRPETGVWQSVQSKRAGQYSADRFVHILFGLYKFFLFNVF